jgi:large subunit ribosomal protein L9
MPQAILLEDVENVGSKGTVVDVSKGYLRNFLVPRKLAQPATKGLLAQAQQAQQAQQRAQAQAVQAAEEQAAVLNRTVVTIAQQAGDDGRLFGSVTPQDIADAIKDARGLDVDRRKIHLDEPIRNVGTYQVVIEVGDGVTSTVKTIVVDTK